ncbi:MAG: SDR family oxidoreductase [Gammaproteobacteria bacterium]|nr:SDR family oxidoreductase [Gammaproteobacteria bacterium]
MKNLKKTILITGATGFIGKHLAQALLTTEIPRFARDDVGVTLHLSSRSKIDFPHHPNASIFSPINLDPEANWSPALANCDVVIHTAARVHVLNEAADNPLYEFRRVNVDGTLALARQAVEHGVKRFIYLSSIGVNGARTVGDARFSAEDVPSPENDYAMSKWEAEQGLQQLAAETGMEVVIIRPPLVYGPDAKGNFQRLISWVNRGLPLPLGAIHNRRSFVSIDNLLSLLMVCVESPHAANQVFLVSDGDDVSTTELLRRVGLALKKPVRLLPIYPAILKMAATVLGKQADVGRLCDSLEIDISKTSSVLGWKPPFNMRDTLVRMVDCS